MAGLEAVGVDAGTVAIKSFYYCQASRRKVTAAHEVYIVSLKSWNVAGYGLSRAGIRQGTEMPESNDTDPDL